jgi:hypothetical protein
VVGKFSEKRVRENSQIELSGRHASVRAIVLEVVGARGAARSQSPLHANTQEPADNTHERTERRITHSLTRALSHGLCACV